MVQRFSVPCYQPFCKLEMYPLEAGSGQPGQPTRPRFSTAVITAPSAPSHYECRLISIFRITLINNRFISIAMGKVVNAPADEPMLRLTPYEDAKSRINLALNNLKENNIPLERYPCVIFHGCQMDMISDTEMRALTRLFLHLCSIQDQRRWSTKSSYIAKGALAYRGVCSRTGNQLHSLIHHTSRTSLKCKCMASFTIFNDGELILKNIHNELCLPDPDMENDGYVFSGLSPTKKSSIIANITDMLSDYGTTSAAARKQIENSLIKSGDTGFGTGKPVDFEL